MKTSRAHKKNKLQQSNNKIKEREQAQFVLAKSYL